MFPATAIGSNGSDWPHRRREASDRGFCTSPPDANEMGQAPAHRLRVFDAFRILARHHRVTIGTVAGRSGRRRHLAVPAGQQAAGRGRCPTTRCPGRSAARTRRHV